MNVMQKLLALAVLAAGVPGIASAGGIYVYEIANSGDIGYGSAGVVVRAQDASTVFTNPAGMTRFKETNTIAGVSPLSDGSIDLYFAPKAPKGWETNWLETIPGKSFFVALRMYGPLEPWINKTWRPGELEPVE